MMDYHPLLGIAALNPTYDLLRSPDAIRERPSRRLEKSPDCIRATGLAVALGRSGLDRDPGAVGTSRPRPLLRATVTGWIGWMTLFLAIGGWVKRHPPYGLLGGFEFPAHGRQYRRADMPKACPPSPPPTVDKAAPCPPYRSSPRSPGASRERSSRCLGKIPGLHPSYGFANPDSAVTL